VFKDSRGEEKNDFNQNRMNANDDGTKSWFLLVLWFDKTKLHIES
jgi:hypothetical protein